MNTTGIVGFLSGTVAYKDGSVGNFNTNILIANQNDFKWSPDDTESKTNLANVFGSTDHRLIMNWLFADMPYFNSLDWDFGNPEDKTIKDMVARLNLNFTFDDGTKFSSTTLYQDGKLQVY